MNKKDSTKKVGLKSKPAAAVQPVAAAPLEPAPMPIPVEPKEITLKAAVSLVFDKSDEALNNSTKWPLIIDANERFAAFCRHRDARFINCLDKHDLETDKIRMAVLSAYYYGRPLVIEFLDNEVSLDLFKDACNQVDPALFADIINKSIGGQERWQTLLRPADGDQFSSFGANPTNFIVVFLATKRPDGFITTSTMPFIIPS